MSASESRLFMYIARKKIQYTLTHQHKSIIHELTELQFDVTTVAYFLFFKIINIFSVQKDAS